VYIGPHTRVSYIVKLKIYARAVLDVISPGPVLLQVEVPTLSPYQVALESDIAIEPYTVLEPFIDASGNHCRRGLLQAGLSTLEYHAVVDISDRREATVQPVGTDVMALPTDVIPYLLPSRYCQSDRLDRFALMEFGNTESGYARVQGICAWINKSVRYEYNTTSSITTALDTITDRSGVCRDFSHLGIALCRALNIPARYVSGYCLGLKPPDFHAYFQAFLDGRWINFDATQVQPRPALVTVGCGRDAADCAWCSFFGYGTTRELNVSVTEI